MTIPFPTGAAAASDSVQFTVVPGPVGFGSVPDAPEVPGMDLNGKAQIISTQMPNFSVRDASGTGLGWGLTVSGISGRRLSPVLSQYCPAPLCGGDSGPGYVPGGLTLPANSLTLDSSGAHFVPRDGSSGSGPKQRCNRGCFIDAPPDSPTLIAAANVGAGMGTFRTAGFSRTSLQLSAPDARHHLPTGEQYRVDLSWSLNRGP